jgi:tRNA A37 threonylcarbamoyladenosine dehydratase
MRKRGFNKGLKCVFSPELPLPLKETDGDCRTNCICPNKGKQEFHFTMRRQIPGSLSFVPSVAGLVLASAVVKDIVAPVLGEFSEEHR